MRAVAIDPAAVQPAAVVGGGVGVVGRVGAGVVGAGVVGVVVGGVVGGVVGRGFRVRAFCCTESALADCAELTPLRALLLVAAPAGDAMENTPAIKAPVATMTPARRARLEPRRR